MIKNPILVEKNKGSKVILRILSIIIYIMLIPIEFTIIFDAVINKNSISETIIITILFGVYTYYLLVSMSNKKVRALKYIKDYMSYKDVLKLKIIFLKQCQRNYQMLIYQKVIL